MPRCAYAAGCFAHKGAVNRVIAKQMFTQGFSGFLWRRLAKQHFERQPLLETLPQPGGTDRSRGRGLA